MKLTKKKINCFEGEFKERRVWFFGQKVCNTLEKNPASWCFRLISFFFVWWLWHVIQSCIVLLYLIFGVQYVVAKICHPIHFIELIKVDKLHLISYSHENCLSSHSHLL